MINWSDFHFMRPWWLLLLPVAIMLFFIPANFKKSVWAKVIEPHLLSHLLSQKIFRRSKLINFIMPLFLCLVVLALAGPAFEKLPTDIRYNKPPVIICLEVSEHMLSSDLEPTRLKRAIYKIEDFLRAYPSAEVSLIAFAGDAHVVVPLSEDYPTILTLARALNPGVMPIKGVNITNALTKANEIASRYSKARVVILTSSNIDDNFAASSLYNAPLPSVTIWTFATKAGAPLKNSQGKFGDNRQGGVSISRQNDEVIKKLAAIDGVNILPFTPDNHDVNTLVKSMQHNEMIASDREIFFDVYRDLGPYILALAVLLLLISYFFARDHLWIFGLCLFLLPSETKALSLTDLFWRRDQQGQLALEKKEYQKAAELFEDDLRKGGAYYRAKMFDEAIAHFSKVNNATGFYNLGNAHAQKGQIAEAIKAYDQALLLDQNHQDAKHNRDLLQKLLNPPKENEQKQNQEQEEKQEQPSANPSKKSQEESKNQSENSPKNSDEPEQKDSSENKDSANPSPSKKEEAQKDNEQKSDDAPKPSPNNEMTKPASPNNQEPNKDFIPDKETNYFLDKIKETSNSFLKKKFKEESRRNQEGK